MELSYYIEVFNPSFNSLFSSTEKTDFDVTKMLKGKQRELVFIYEHDNNEKSYTNLKSKFANQRILESLTQPIYPLNY